MARPCHSRNRMAPRLAAALLAASALTAAGGCSPRVYKAETQAFADAVATTHEALRESVDAASRAMLDAWITEGVTGDGGVVTAEACNPVDTASVRFGAMANDETPVLTAAEIAELRELLGSSSGCGAVLIGLFGKRLLKAEPLAPKTLETFEGLAGYARLLAELAGADDLDAVNSKATELGQALASLAGKVDSKAGTDISTTIGPMTALVQWLGQSYLDHKRFMVLKRAVTTAQPIVEQAGAVVSSEAVGLATIRAIGLHRRAIELLNRGSRAGGSLQRQDDLAAAVGHFSQAESVVRVDTADAADAMVKAHAALLRELDDPTTQRDALIKAIREFHARAKALLAVAS